MTSWGSAIAARRRTTSTAQARSRTATQAEITQRQWGQDKGFLHLRIGLLGLTIYNIEFIAVFVDQWTSQSQGLAVKSIIPKNCHGESLYFLNEGLY